MIHLLHFLHLLCFVHIRLTGEQLPGEQLQPVTATQSSMFQTFRAGNCIDGRIIDGDVCHTLGDATPWFAIDFGTSVSVQRVEIFNRPDCCGDRTRNVDVRISDELPTSASEMFSGGTLLGHFAGPGAIGQHIIISGEKQLLIIVNVICPRSSNVW